MAVVKAERNRYGPRNAVRQGKFRLEPRGGLVTGLIRMNAIIDGKPEVIPTQASFDVQLASQEVRSLLSVSGRVRHMGKSA